MPDIVHANPWFSVSRGEFEGREIYRISASDSALVIGRTGDGGVLLVRGLRDRSRDAVSFELPGGMIDRGETPQEAAVREVGEESGFDVTEISPLGSFYTVAAISDARCHVFEASLGHAGSQNLEDGEMWCPVVVTLDELQRYVNDGRIHDSSSLSAICQYLVHHSISNFQA